MRQEKIGSAGLGVLVPAPPSPVSGRCAGQRLLLRRINDFSGALMNGLGKLSGTAAPRAGSIWGCWARSQEGTVSPCRVAQAAGRSGGVPSVPVPWEWGWEQGDEQENHPGGKKSLMGSAGPTDIPEDTTEEGLRPEETKDQSLDFAGCSLTPQQVPLVGSALPAAPALARCCGAGKPPDPLLFHNYIPLSKAKPFSQLLSAQQCPQILYVCHLSWGIRGGGRTRRFLSAVPVRELHHRAAPWHEPLPEGPKQDLCHPTRGWGVLGTPFQCHPGEALQ